MRSSSSYGVSRVFSFYFLTVILVLFCGHLSAQPSSNPMTGRAARGGIAILKDLHLGIEAPVAASGSSETPLPTELAGISVSLDGIRARLRAVGPSSIEFVVPPGVKVGTAEVVISGSVAGGMNRFPITISDVAPVLLTTGPGTSPCGIINAVTKASGPFPVHTPDNPTKDKRTRLLLYGTGIRNLRPNDSADSTNAIQQFVEAVDSRGKAFALPVETFGPSAVAEGIDEITAIVPGEMDGAGLVRLSLVVGTERSNAVKTIVRSSIPPIVDSAAPHMGSPGSTMTLAGKGFAPFNYPDRFRRTMVVLIPSSRPDLEITLRPLGRVASESLMFRVPPIALPDRSWYEGPATVCVVVDGVRNCGSEIEIGPKMKAPGRLGSLLLPFVKARNAAAAQLARDLGKAGLADSFEMRRRSDLLQLENVIELLNGGKPAHWALRRRDGSVRTVLIDRQLLEDQESLLAADMNETTLRSSLVGENSRPPAASTGNCGLKGELNLIKLWEQYQGFQSDIDAISTIQAVLGPSVSLGACLGGAVLGGPAGCLAGMAAAMSALAPIEVVLIGVHGGAMFGLVTLGVSNMFLEDIDIQPSAYNFPSGSTPASTSVFVQGRFAPLFSGTSATTWMVAEIAKEIFFAALPDILMSVDAPSTKWGQTLTLNCGGLCAQINNICPVCLKNMTDFFNNRFSEFAETIFDSFSFPNGGNLGDSTLVYLGAATLTVHNPSPSAVQLALACHDGDSNVLTALSGPSNTNLFVKFLNNNLGIWSSSHEPGGSVARGSLSVTVPAPTGSFSTNPASTLPFGGSVVNSSTTLTVTVQNSGNSAFNVTGLQISGTNASAFQQSPAVSVPQSVVPGSSVQIPIVFAPTTAANYSATLCIGNDSSNATPSRCIALTGSGTASLPSAPVLVSPGTLTGPGQLVPNTTPTLTWLAASGTSSYGVYVSISPYGETNIVFKNENVSSTATSLQIPAGSLQDGGLYRWNMAAKNASGWTYSAAPYYFQVSSGSSAPVITGVLPSNIPVSSAPYPLSIAGTGLSSAAKLVFTLPNASIYTVNSNNFLAYTGGITLDVPLPVAGTWTVQAVTAGNQNSNAFPFQVGNAPQKPGSFQLTTNPAACNPPPSVTPQVSINWTASSQVTNYWIYRNSSPAATVDSGTLSWTDQSNLSAGTAYTYYVVANNSQGTTQSNSVNVNIPANICYTQSGGNIVLSNTSFTPVFNLGAPASSIGLTIKSDTGKPMQGTAASNVSWLIVDGHASYGWMAPESVTLTFNPAGLAAATYQGTITIASPQATNTAQVSVTMQVLTPLVITSLASLPDAIAGQTYNYSLQATGGTGLTWTLGSGPLPSGLTLNPATGTISGTPIKLSGSTNMPFSVTVQDSLGRSTTQWFSITWRQGVVISTPAQGMPQWIVGSAVLNLSGYSFTVSGGTQPYHWTASGSLPPGVTLSDSGVFSGTPTTAGKYPVLLIVTDSAGLAGSINATFQVILYPLQVTAGNEGTPALLSSGVAGTAYGPQFLLGTGGTQTGYQWVVTGALPPGITATPNTGCTKCSLGFSGTPTTSGIYPFTVTVTDSAGTSTSAYIVLVINQPGSAPKITKPFLTLATIGQLYSYSFAATGGTGTLQ